MVNALPISVPHSERAAVIQRCNHGDDAVDELREAQRRWLERVMKARDWSAGHWAELAGLSPSTISRFINSTDHKFLLTFKTLSKLATAANVPMFQHGKDNEAIPGLDEEELEMIPFDTPNPRTSTWRIKGQAMRNAGFLPNDMIEFDPNPMPHIDDIVLARVKSTGETVMRIYAPPYLLAASNHPSDFPPLYVDGNNVMIIGVMLRSWRERPDRNWKLVDEPSAA